MADVLIFNPERCQPAMNPGATMSLDEVQLSAGTNELTSEQMQKVQQHPDYARFEKLRAIELVEKSEIVDPLANSEIIDLSGYSIEAAQSIINATNNVETLDSWLKNESRAKVRSTIATRIAQLKEGSI